MNLGVGGKSGKSKAYQRGFAVLRAVMGYEYLH